jgi:hypothetical protein
MHAADRFAKLPNEQQTPHIGGICGIKAMKNKPDKLREAWIDRFEMVGPHYCRPLPKRLHGQTCGAKLRDGARCPRTDISKRNGRCLRHGGASTGPRTPAGKARCAANSGLPAMWAEIRTEVGRMDNDQRR